MLPSAVDMSTVHTASKQKKNAIFANTADMHKGKADARYQKRQAIEVTQKNTVCMCNNLQSKNIAVAYSKYSEKKNAKT